MDFLKNKKKLKSSIENIRTKYPNKIPAFVFRSKKDKTFEDLECSKFLVPDNITLGQFIIIIRKRLQLTSETSLFLFINNNLPCSSDTMSQIYEKYKNKEGMLVMEYCGENVFG